MSRLVTLSIKAFKGLDQSKDDALLDPGASPEAYNVQCRAGGLQSVAAPEAFIAEALPGCVASLIPFYPRNAPAQLLAATHEALYAWDALAGRWETLLEGLSEGRFEHVNYARSGEDILLLAGGVDGAYLWNGSVMEPLPAEVGKLSHIALHMDRVWGAGMPDEPDTAHWSRVYDAADWAPDYDNPEEGGGFVLMPTWNHGRVRALVELFGDVVVFKDTDIFRIYGTYPGNYEVVRVHGVVGPLASRAIVSTGDQCFFLSPEGLCAYDGIRAKPVGERRAQRVLSELSSAWAPDSCAAFFDNALVLAVPSQGAEANDTLLLWHLEEGLLTMRRGVSAASLLPFGGQLLMGGADGVVRALSCERDAAGGTPLGAMPLGAMPRAMPPAPGMRDAYWRTPWIDFGEPDADKVLTDLSLGGGGRLWLTVETDRHSRALPIVLGRDQRKTLRVPVRGRRFRFILRSDARDAFALRGGMRIRAEIDE